MLSVEEALRAVLERATPLAPVRLRLERAAGAVLAEEVASDLDLPPFNKALVDGFAVRSADLAGSGTRRLRVVGEITAGMPPGRPISAGEAVSIMTGAPLPDGADAVVMHEVTTPGDGPTVAIAGPVAPGLNRLERGREMRAGEIVARRGDALTPARLGVLASVGRPAVAVVRRPRVAVIPTGNELVGADGAPGPGQIRNSNAYTLGALLAATGAEVFREPIARDDLGALRERFAAALEAAREPADVLVVSGGVSAGTLDLVPSALAEVGVEAVFHKIALRPGKPLWFGLGRARPGGGRPLVFGLPGNPVSGLVGVLLFVNPALEALAGRPASGPRSVAATLAAPYAHRGVRATYHPARLVGEPGAWRVEPLPWAGSPDLLTVSRADGFAAFPPGDRVFDAGERVAFLPLDPRCLTTTPGAVEPPSRPPRDGTRGSSP